MYIGDDQNADTTLRGLQRLCMAIGLTMCLITRVCAGAAVAGDWGPVVQLAGYTPDADGLLCALLRADDAYVYGLPRIGSSVVRGPLRCLGLDIGLQIPKPAKISKPVLTSGGILQAR